MSAAKLMEKKFQGCMVGSLIGDCLGEPFESAEVPVSVSGIRVANFLDALRKGDKKPGSLPYTDDTAMIKVLAKSLVQNKKIDHKDLANKLTDLFFTEPDRGYGIHVGLVFYSLKGNPMQDVLKPASDQFNGSGSYGNGAAMRVSPVGLFFHKDIDLLIEAARESSLVTHAHCNGYNGAVLQALAVRQALLLDPSQPVNPQEFVLELRKYVEVLEKNRVAYYTRQLKNIEELLSESDPPDIHHVVDKLGNNVTALKSVPIAIYAFLASTKPIKGIHTENMFERTIHYAISLGGDTDTIASMAGGICGAYLGIDAIPKHLITPCEAHEELLHVADELYNATFE